MPPPISRIHAEKKSTMLTEAAAKWKSLTAIEKATSISPICALFGGNMINHMSSQNAVHKGRSLSGNRIPANQFSRTSIRLGNERCILCGLTTKAEPTRTTDETRNGRSRITESVNRVWLRRIVRRLAHGNNSLCGLWSRFQRAKAVSLVSANKNCSDGDST